MRSEAMPGAELAVVVDLMLKVVTYQGLAMLGELADLEEAAPAGAAELESAAPFGPARPVGATTVGPPEADSPSPSPCVTRGDGDRRAPCSPLCRWGGLRRRVTQLILNYGKRQRIRYFQQRKEKGDVM